MNQRLSSLRAKLLQAQQLLPGLLESCLGREPLLPGSLYTLRRKCGKPSCHCNRGELHESTVLSYRGQGRPRNVSPQPEHLDGLRDLTDHYRRCRQARAQLVRWQKQLLQLVDELEALRVQQGEAEFHKLGGSRHRQPRSSRS
jgi:hypothetical protein